jgi:ABC-2 type transport system ATP-binding protein
VTAPVGSVVAILSIGGQATKGLQMTRPSQAIALRGGVPDDRDTRSVAVSLESIGKRFTSATSTTDAVQNVSLELCRGEVVGFLGANGAGKSTTMKLLAGALTPTSGRVRVLGGDPRSPATRRSIGYLPGDLELPGSWTGEQALRLFAGLRSTAVDWRPWCERLAYDPTRRIGTLSTGNRRKLGVIQAFMSEPEVLLLDEPTSGLDPFVQRTFDELVDEARRRGAAVLLSSHVLPEVERSADRVAVIRRGRLVRVGTLDELHRSTQQRLEFHTAAPLDAAGRAALRRVAEAVESDPSGRCLTVTVTGPVQPVLDALSVVGVERIVPRAAGLERLLDHEPEGTHP